MPEFHKIGAEAEKRAADYLIEQGYTVIVRNFRGGGSEIDLIAMDGDTVVFVEVRSRRSSAWAGPEESVDEAKQRRLWKTAEFYLAEIAGKEMPARFDVIAIEGETVRHHMDAFRPALP
ncbi:MAG: YraN family protein [Armatimonadetes bacterium]|nr:YraN family protein [Armatimonadota bacterium]